MADVKYNTSDHGYDSAELLIIIRIKKLFPAGCKAKKEQNNEKQLNSHSSVVFEQNANVKQTFGVF